jgi:acyl-CoA synthetase (AMP-forming)/AMP-acid ligase II
VSHSVAIHPTSILELLRSRAAGEADRAAYTFLADGETDERTVTWQELDQHARALAARLRDALPSGERAILIYPPGLEFITAFLGCLYAGTVAVCVPLPHAGRMSAGLSAVEAICRDARPFVALSTELMAAMIADSFAQLGGLRTLQWLNTDNPPDPVPDYSPQEDLRGDRIAYLQYTSGSTASPKGVMVTHANLLAHCDAMRRVMRATPEDVFVSWLPMFHDMGLVCKVLLPLYVGARSVLMSPLSFLQQPARWLQAISRHRGTISVGPNFAFELCVRKVDNQSRSKLDLCSWSLAGSGSEPVRHRTLERFGEAFGPCGFNSAAFFPAYGLAEATLVVSANPRETPPHHCSVQTDELERGRIMVLPDTLDIIDRPGPRVNLVSCGRAVADTQIVIANPETKELCSPDQIGEVWVSGPGVARGYWRRPDESRDAFHAYLSNTGAGPFLRTGDLGFLRDAELYIVGRLKDLIILDGRNHHPQDLEYTIEQANLPLRPGCCVTFSVEVNDSECLVVVAEVDPKQVTVPMQDDVSSGRTTALAIERAIRAAIALRHEIRVHDVVLLQAGSVPKTSSGKPRRHACQAEYEAGRLPRWSP